VLPLNRTLSEPTDLISGHRLYSFYSADAKESGIFYHWKNHRSALPTRKIFSNQHPLWRKLDAVGYAGIFYVPQTQKRMVRLQGSSSRDFAALLSYKLRAPILEAFTAREESEKKALRPLWDRTHLPELSDPESKYRFRPEFLSLLPYIKGRKVLIVDDFTTTGDTLKSYSLLLGRWGIRDFDFACVALFAKKGLRARNSGYTVLTDRRVEKTSFDSPRFPIA
jgi:predicted amidophosphoribosyltransferase